MAISFVNAGAEGSAGSGNITLGAPASPQTDDIWIAVIHSSDQVSHTFAGWTQVAEFNGGSTTSHLSVWWFRYAGATPNLVVVHASGQSPIGGIAAFRGCKAWGTPVDVIGATGGGTDESIEVAGAVTPTHAGDMIVICEGSADDNNRSGLPTDFVAAFEDAGASTQACYVTTAGTPDGSVGCHYKVHADTSQPGTLTVTQAAADPWASIMILLAPDDGIAVTDVVVRATQVACSTSAGNQDITISGFEAPKAALLFLTNGTSAGTEVVNAFLCLGGTDGTRQWCSSVWDSDNQANMVAKRRYDTTRLIAGFLAATPTTADAEAAFGSWIEGGIRINWTNAPPAGWLLTVVLFGGADLTARADTVAEGNTTGTQTYSSMGFQFDGLIACAGSTDPSTSIVASGNTRLGFVSYDGSTLRQCSMVRNSIDAAANATIAAAMNAAALFCESDLVRTFTMQSVTSSGFTWSCDLATTEDWSFLAINTGTLDCWAGQVNSPTGTGDWSVTSPAFKPQAVLLGLNAVQASDTLEEDDDAGPYGYSVFDENGADFCATIRCDDGNTTSDTGSVNDTDAVDLNSATGAAMFDATYSSMNATGWSLNFSAADGTVRKWIAFAVEAAVGAFPAMVRRRRVHPRFRR